MLPYFPGNSKYARRCVVDTVGALFGAIASVDVFCMMLSSLIFNTIYSKTLEVSSTFFFLVMAAFYVVSCILLLSV